MTKIRLLPHKTADPASVVFGDWWIDRNGSHLALPDVLRGWDYARSETLGVNLTFDEQLLLESTGLEDFSDITVLLVADCRESQTRIVSRHNIEAGARQRDAAFALDLPAGQLAGSVSLSAQVVLGRDLPRSASGSAYLRGARLIWSKPRTIALEGEASRFPTEPVAFSEMYLPHAPWTVLTTFQSPDASFMGGVRLLVNTEHNVGRMLLDESTAQCVAGLAMADIIRLLVAIMSEYVEDLRTDHDEGSVAYVIDTMCDFYLGRDLASAVRLYKDEPIQFDRIMHERVEPLAKVFE